jgi:histidine triad (HIT) family protein
MSDCVFCRLLSGEWPAAFVHRDARVAAFMDAGQVNDGHVIVATTRHVETIYDLDDDEAAAVFRTAARIARAVKREFAAAGVTLLQANERAGFQTVPHFHLHVLARHPDDGVGLTWPAKRPPFDRLSELAQRLRAALGAGSRQAS